MALMTFVHYHQISPEAFNQHFQFYHRHYNLTSLKTLADGRRLPPKPIFISFDDGWGTNYELLPIYNNMPKIVTIFLSVDFIKTNRRPHLSIDQIKEMKTVVNFQNHGMMHRDMTQLPEDEARHDLFKSKQIIEEITGEPVYAFAYPYNKCTPELARLVEECGYKLARMGDRTLNHQDANRFTLKSIGIPENASVLDVRYRLLKARVKTLLREPNVY
jgi:peptidoglycan/xylan/chitin deacetylase (PgdA/CDA1 family)